MPPYNSSSRGNSGLKVGINNNAGPWGSRVPNKVPKGMMRSTIPSKEKPRAVHLTSSPPPQQEPSRPTHFWERREEAMRLAAAQQEKQSLSDSMNSSFGSREEKRSVPRVLSIGLPQEKMKDVKPLYVRNNMLQKEKRISPVTPPEENRKNATPTYARNGLQKQWNQKPVAPQKQQQQQLLPTKKKTRTPSKSVKFSDVTITSFERTLGDNPCAQGGAPMGMDKKHFSSRKSPLTAYEKSKGERRGSDQMRIPLATRRNILMQARTPVEDWNRVEGELKAINDSRTADLNMRSYGSMFSDDDERDDTAPHDC